MEVKAAVAVVWLTVLAAAVNFCFWCLNQPSNVLVLAGWLGLVVTMLSHVYFIRTRIQKCRAAQKEEVNEEAGHVDVGGCNGESDGVHADH